MGTEIAIPVFGPLIFIGTALLIYLAISGRRKPVSESSALGMGRSRLALGLLGVLVAALAYSYWDTVELSRYKVVEGHVTQAEADQYFWGWFLNLFCLATPFIYFFFAVLGLPILKLLRRIGFLSILGALVASQVIALLISGYAALLPDSDWCRANSLQCAAHRYGEAAPLLGLVAIAFALASRLPWLRGLRGAS